MPFAQENGGFGGTISDVAVLMEAFGKALVVEPYLPSIVLAGRFLEALGSEAQRSRWLQPLMSGDCLMALAHTERATSRNLQYVACETKLDNEEFVVSGEKVMVLNGGAADQLLITARSSGQPGDSSGIEVFLLDTPSEGLSITTYETVDGMRAADVQMNAVRLSPDQRLGNPDTNWATIETVMAEATIAMAAEALGAMSALLSCTVDYTQTRKQFGSPISKFQVLQHRMVDMYIAVEEMCSLLWMALTAAEQGDDTGMQHAASALKVHLGSSGVRVGAEAIQMHGGMGTTDELSIGHYYKRLLAMDALLGSSNFHLDRFDELSG